MTEIVQYFSQNPWIAGIVTACTILLSMLVGGLINAKISKASSNRAILDRELAAVQEGIERVQESLAPLSNVARGRVPKSMDMERDCINAIMNLRLRARNISRRLPHTRREFQKYSEVMIELTSLVSELDGKNDRIRLMEGVAKFIMAQREFEDQIQRSRWLSYASGLWKWARQKRYVKMPSNDMNKVG